MSFPLALQYTFALNAFSLSTNILPILPYPITNILLLYKFFCVSFIAIFIVPSTVEIAFNITKFSSFNISIASTLSNTLFGIEPANNNLPFRFLVSSSIFNFWFVY